MELEYYKRYCKDIEDVENYEKALADNFVGWECHHRLETHTSDGERRLVDVTRKELIALDTYYDRPSEELIFLTRSKHNTLHHKGKRLSEDAKKKMHKPKSEEHKKKLSEARKRKYTGEKHPMYGKHHSEETKNKLRETSRMNSIGRHWYNDGKISKRAYECPEGFVPGRL